MKEVRLRGGFDAAAEEGRTGGSAVPGIEGAKRAEAEALARADFARADGTVVLLGEFFAHDDSGERAIVYCDPPLEVRVVSASAADLAREDAGWLVPLWNIDPVEPVLGLRRCWMHGPAYHLLTGLREDAGS